MMKSSTTYGSVISRTILKAYPMDFSLLDPSQYPDDGYGDRRRINKDINRLIDRTMRLSDGPSKVHAYLSAVRYVCREHCVHAISSNIFVYNKIFRNASLVTGPVYIDESGKHYWCDNQIDRTDEINGWMEEMNMPKYAEWTDHEKSLFALRFDHE